MDENNNLPNSNNNGLTTSNKANDGQTNQTPKSGFINSNPNRESITDKIKKAREAMEGPARTLKREERETEQRVEDEKNKLRDDLKILAKKKEELEINWVVLDKKQAEIKKLLDPIKAEEEKLETEEETLESKEHTTGDIKQRQEVEQKRWAVQDQRKDLEKKKWELENKILAIEDELQTNTKKYQELLDEEEVLNKKIETLDYEVAVAKEKIALQKEEEEKAKQSRLVLEEQRRREEKLQAEAKRLAVEKEAQIEKQKQALEAEKKEEVPKPETRVAGSIMDLKPKTPTTENQKPLPKESAQDHLQAIIESQKKRAEMEINRRAKLDQPTTTSENRPSPDIKKDDDLRRAEILKTAKNLASGSEVKKTVVETPANTATKPEEQVSEEKNSVPEAKMIDLKNIDSVDEPQPTTEKKIEPVEMKKNLTQEQEVEIPSYLPNEKSSIPVIRTFKNDIANNSELTPDQIKQAQKKFPWLKK